MTSIKAYAKINLSLRVLGKRSDGYHELETIFQQISLYDQLFFSPAANGITLTCDQAECPADERNIVYRAAALVQQHGGTALGVRIRLEKKIPLGAGLGGGSSDAAATLRALQQMWHLHFDEALLHQLAVQLGADVPFFLHGGAALATGVGEKLHPVALPQNYWGVLIYPGFPISTAWVYQNLKLDLTKLSKSSKFYSLTDLGNDITLWQDQFVNDLEKVVFKEYPELDHLRDQLATAGAFLSRMSGSGSSIFGLFDSRARAERALLGVGTSYQRFLFSPICLQPKLAETA